MDDPTVLLWTTSSSSRAQLLSHPCSHVKQHFELDQTVLDMLREHGALHTETFIESLCDTECFSNVRENRWILCRSRLDGTEQVFRIKERTKGDAGTNVFAYREHRLTEPPSDVFARLLFCRLCGDRKCQCGLSCLTTSTPHARSTSTSFSALRVQRLQQQQYKSVLLLCCAP